MLGDGVQAVGLRDETGWVRILPGTPRLLEDRGHVMGWREPVAERLPNVWHPSGVQFDQNARVTEAGDPIRVEQVHLRSFYVTHNEDAPAISDDIGQPFRRAQAAHVHSCGDSVQLGHCSEKRVGIGVGLERVHVG